jgi:hypothetical protein
METHDTSPLLCPAISRVITTRLDPIFNEYKQTTERFNIGIIDMISDYYSIIDKHSDQFNQKFMHVYSGNKGHYNPILATNDKLSKFNLEELVDIFNEHCYELHHFKLHTDTTHMQHAREQTWSIYQQLSNYIASENVYDLSNLYIFEFEQLIDCLRNLSNKLNDDEVDKLNHIRGLIQQFNNIKLDFKPSEEILDYCECGNIMQVMADSSEIVCSNCGFLYELKGTVFSDCQFYSQESIRYKHAGYEPSKHVKSWIERIQARETNTITDQQLMKIEECIKRDGITNKKRITIDQFRRYLKDVGLTELNEHVALIRRLMTGIVPPQLTYVETQNIISSFSKAIKAYNIVKPSNKSNIPFYPFLVWKLIELHVSDYNKRKSLLSFIHLQGTQTIIQNDNIWAQICAVAREFVYKPTDRYLYFD